MNRILKLGLAVLVVSGLGVWGLMGDSHLKPVTNAYAGSQQELISSLPGPLGKLMPEKPYSARTLQHGTHLCSADDHCGTGHKCCSGHCKASVTC